MRKVVAVKIGPHYYITRVQFSCREMPEARYIKLLVDIGSTVTTLYAERIGISREIYEELEESEPSTVVGGEIIPRKLHDVTLVFMTSDGGYLPIYLEECDVVFVTEETIEDGVLGMDVLGVFRGWEATKSCCSGAGPTRLYIAGSQPRGGRGGR